MPFEPWLWGRFGPVAMSILSLAGCLCLHAQAEQENGWSQAAHLQFYDAFNIFRQLPPSREQRLGEAAALLNVQPRTVANRERAKTLLSELVATPPADNITQAGHYLLGRIASVHEGATQYETARRHFSAASKGNRNSSYAQLARAQLAVYALQGDTTSDHRIRAAAEHARALPAGAIRATVHWIIAQALLESASPPREALLFIELALADGLVTSAARADALVAATYLSALVSPSDSPRWRETFLREFPRDPRAAHLRQPTLSPQP